MNGRFAHLGYNPATMVRDGVVIYGLHSYGSMFDLNVNKRTKAYARQARRVYAFKKTNAGGDVFVELVKRFAGCVDADVVVAVPSSQASRLSRLQDEFGVYLRRVKDSEPRKYNHNQPVLEDGNVLLEIDVTGRRVLLVDDIVTTGSSILFFSKMLTDAGAAHVFPLGIGLSYSKSDYYPDAALVDEVFASVRESLKPKSDDGGDNHPLEEIFAGIDDDHISLSSLDGFSRVTLSGALAQEFEDKARGLNLKPEELLNQVVRKFLDTAS